MMTPSALSLANELPACWHWWRQLQSEVGWQLVGWRLTCQHSTEDYFAGTTVALLLNSVWVGLERALCRRRSWKCIVVCRQQTPPNDSMSSLTGDVCEVNRSRWCTPRTDACVCSVAWHDSRGMTTKFDELMSVSEITKNQTILWEVSAAQHGWLCRKPPIYQAPPKHVSPDTPAITPKHHQFDH